MDPERIKGSCKKSQLHPGKKPRNQEPKLYEYELQMVTEQCNKVNLHCNVRNTNVLTTTVKGLVLF